MEDWKSRSHSRGNLWKYTDYENCKLKIKLDIRLDIEICDRSIPNAQDEIMFLSFGDSR